DPTTNATQTDTVAGRALYVAWNSNHTAPTAAPANFNPNIIMVIGSGDGGTTFTAPQIVSDGGNNSGNDRYADPQMFFTQGTADGRVTGGQLGFTWNDFVNNRIRLDTSQPDAGSLANLPVSARVFAGTTGTITDAAKQVASAAVVAGGTGYTLGDVLTVNNGVNGTLLPPATAATLRVTAVAALSVSVSAGGTGYAVGDVLTILGRTPTARRPVTGPH